MDPKTLSLLPSNLKTVIEVDMQVGEAIFGPNCWNAAQMFHDESIPQRFTDWDEMDNWLENNTVEIEHGMLQLGDILVMRNTEHPYHSLGMLWHTAIYLDENTMFQKRGCSGPYEVVPHNEVLGFYYHARDLQWRRFVKQEPAKKAA